MICLTLIRLISCELRNENETEATELGTECAMFIVWHYSPHRRGARPVEKKSRLERAQPQSVPEPHFPKAEIFLRRLRRLIMKCSEPHSELQIMPRYASGVFGVR